MRVPSCFAFSPKAYCFKWDLPDLLSVEEINEVLNHRPSRMFNWTVVLTERLALRRISIIDPDDQEGFNIWKLTAVSLGLNPAYVHLKGELVAGRENVLCMEVMDNRQGSRISLITPDYWIIFPHLIKEEVAVHPLVSAAFQLELARWRVEFPHAEEVLMGLEKQAALIERDTLFASSLPGGKLN